MAHRSDRLAATGLDTVLFATDGALQQLDSNLPHSGFEYVEGGMLYDGAVQEVDLYRGDNVYHWGFWKKSWRVKTKRGALYKGCASSTWSRRARRACSTTT